MNHLKLTFILLLFTLSACSSLSPNKEQWNTNDLLSSARSADNRFHSTQYEDDLLEAIDYYSYVLKRHPHNINVQDYYYSLLFQRDFQFNGEASNELISFYESINPLVRKTVPPPEYLAYLIDSMLNEANDNEKIKQLLNIITIHPEHSYLWSTLSDKYALLNSNDLAIASAKRAHELSPHNKSYLFDLAEKFLNYIEGSACETDEISYNKRAVGLYSESLKNFEKNSAYHLYQLGTLYLRLGLVPMAYESTKKAIRIKGDHRNKDINDYLKAAMILGKYDDIVDDILNNKKVYNDILAIHAFHNNHISVAANILEKTDLDKYGILYHLRLFWLKEINGKKVNFESLNKLRKDNPWWIQLKELFLTSNNEQEKILKKAKNGCEKTEAYFYLAYWYWRNGEFNKAQTALSKVQNFNMTQYVEYIWAPLLTKHLFSKNNMATNHK